MRHFFAPAALLAACLCPALAHAADVTVSCTGPTKWDTGALIAPGTVIDYRLYGGFAGKPKTVLDTKPACAFVRTNVAAGTAEYYVTAVIEGAESDPSATKTVVVPPTPVADRDGDGVSDATDTCPDVAGPAPTGCPPKPEPPTLVTTSTSAYELRGTANAPTLALTGIAPLGVVCGPETRVVNGVTYCRVPKMQIDAVVWPQNLALTDLWVKGAPQ
jgi:hypothetical protein